MDRPTQSDSATSSPTASPRVAECWADLARSLTLYPETNSRVQRSLASFFGVLRAGFDATTQQVEVGFSARSVWVADDAFELKAGTNLAWLKDRLDRADLSGAVFSAAANEAALLQFNRRLLELYTRRNLELEFQALWPDAYAGIYLLERRFEGAFSDQPGEDASDAPPSVAGRGRHKVTTLCNALTKDERIRGRIQEIQQKIIRPADEKVEFSQIDLIARIVDLLPVEGLNDYQTAVDFTTRVLGVLEERLAESRSSPSLVSLDRDETLRHLLFVISRSLFECIDAGKHPGTEQLQPQERGRQDADQHEAPSPQVRDEEIQEDLALLMREMQELAPLETARMRPGDLEDPVEQLGVLLHYLVTLDDPSRCPLLKDGIARLLRSPDEGVIGVLRAYLEPTGSPAVLAKRVRRGRVAVWLRKNSRHDLLGRSGVLDAEWATSRFPEGFLLYVQTLDLGDVRDAEELSSVCLRIGRERFLEAKDLLTGATEFLAGPLPSKIFNLPFASVAPLARHIYDKKKSRYQADFARFLRATLPKGIDQALLDAVDPQSLLPGYLNALIENDNEKLAEQRLRIVHSLVATIEDDLNKLKSSVRPIKLLTNFDTPRVRAFLKRVVGARKALLLKKYPRDLRQAAASVLRSFKRGKHSQHV